MGKSTASCFKIISCAGESVEHDDLQAPESKGSGDQRRWSFRKRSARHRVLSNSVISEAPSYVNKENPESPAVNISVQTGSNLPEKPSVIQLTEEKTKLPLQLDANLSHNLSSVDDDSKKGTTLDETRIIIIQASIRRMLAQQLLLKQKNIIKLQAAVRGHLVRRHAVGTLRCVQSIIKMQALVRTRQAGRLDDNDPTLLGKKEAKPNTRYTYVSIEKLLTNAFARQLVESTPRNKSINIKCDPSKSDSAWKWLERWMSASSVRSTGSPESESTEEIQKENLGHLGGQEDILIPSDCYAGSKDVKSTWAALAETSKTPTNLVSRDSTNLDLPLPKSISPTSSLSDLQEVDELNATTEATESAPAEMKETDFIEVIEVNSLLRNGNKMEDEQTEAKEHKLLKKASNVAVVACQSKFGDLTSAKLTPSYSHDLGVDTDLNKNNFSVSTNESLKSMGNWAPDNATASATTSVVPMGSDCGTELSISSTLDSPDRLEVGANEIEQEMKDTNETEHFKTEKNLVAEVDEKKATTLETDSSFTDTNGSKMYRSVSSTAAQFLDSTNAVDSPTVQQKSEANPSDLQLKVESDASPRSHITEPKSKMAPGSQVSLKPKKRKGKKSDSSSRRSRSSLVDKNHNQDSGCLDQPRETKAGNRRISFGSDSKPDHKEHEPRDSSNSNSLPSYMQATESARAKAILNGSPRSSPDVHDKDVYIKKRHSLPGTNDEQGSPRIQRSMAQADQKTKGTAVHSPQDRKWRR